MQRVKKLIDENLERHPSHEDFFVAIDLAIDPKSTPDVRLDSAKSLLEGVCKTLLKDVGSGLHDNYLNKMKLEDAFKRLMKELSGRSKDFEEEFIAQLGKPLKPLLQARNNKGDISHGHVAPKQNSSEEFADLLCGYVSETCLYVLRIFYALDLSYLEPVKYNKNPKFNNFLDETHESIGKVLYSKALHELDYDFYIDELDGFNADY